MRSIPIIVLDGVAHFHDSGGDYDDADSYDLVDDRTDTTLEEVIRRHHGERLVITIQVLGPPRTRGDWLHRLSATVGRQLDVDHWLSRRQQHLEHQQDLARRRAAFDRPARRDPGSE